MCPYKYNPLLRGGFDESKRDINDLEDVNTAGTTDGYVLAWEESSGTWKPSAACAGDMLKSDYDQLDDGVVDNSERLEGETLGSVQAHTVDAINILGTLTDAQIPDVETLSYGVAFADGQIPTLDASKIISGTIDATQIPDLPTSRIATGTFIADRIPTIENLKGTVPDSKIPDMDTLSYGAAFAGAQIPNLPTTRITTGTFNSDRIPILPTNRYGSAVLVSGERTLTANLNFGSHEAVNMQLEQLGSHPAAARGRIYYNTTDDKIYVHIGTA